MFVGFSFGVLNLLRGKNSLDEAGAFLGQLFDPFDFDEIDPDSDDHLLLEYQYMPKIMGQQPLFLNRNSVTQKDE